MNGLELHKALKITEIVNTSATGRTEIPKESEVEKKSFAQFG